jgi:hypothetical protein
MNVEPFEFHTNRSAPDGSPPLFIFSPNGSPVDRLIPRYKPLKVLLEPVQV